MSFSERLCTAGTFQGAGPSWQTPVKLETTQCHTGRVPSSNCTLALRAGSSCCNNDWLQSMFSFKPWTVRPNLQVDSNHLRAVLLCPRKIIVLSKHPHLRCDTSSIRNVFSLTYSQPLSVDDISLVAASNATNSNKSGSKINHQDPTTIVCPCLHLISFSSSYPPPSCIVQYVSLM